MVADVLVDSGLIEDGRELIANLVRDGFEVTVGFWVRSTERGSMRLFIASPLVIAGQQLGNLPLRVYDQLRLMPHSTVEYSQVRLIPATDPAARDAIELRDRRPGSLRPIQVFERLGDLAIESAYIYERISAALTREQVLQRVVELMEQSGLRQPSKLTLKDGSIAKGIVVGLEMQQGVGIAISIQDPVSNTPHPVSVDSVANIE